MKNKWLLIYLLLSILPCAGFAQAPNLGITSGFVVFSKTGAITGAAGLALTGNLGRETAGALSGVTADEVKGTIYIGVGNVTTKCTNDLQAAYDSIDAIPASQFKTHSNTFSDETIKPGVIDMGTSAAYANGNVYFDALGDSNSVFIIHMRAALVTAASFNCYLIGNARSRNIFWVVEGALTFGADNNVLGSFIALTGAIDVGYNTTLEGRLTSTTGAMTLHNLHAVASPGMYKNYWNGAATKNADWFNTLNWGIDVPDSSSNIYIQKKSAANPYYPVIGSSTRSLKASVLNLTIDNGAVLTISNNNANGFNSKLSVSGAIVDTFGIDARAGTLEFNGIAVSPQIMPARLFVNNTVQNLILSNNVNITGLQNLTGNLSFTGANRILNTNGFLALKSTANGTAQLADITNGGTSTGNAIVGNVSIERYVSPRRAWRLLSVPIVPSGSVPTINASWQEGATTDTTNQKSSNPSPGFGTFITGGYENNGYDIGVNHHPTLKVYDNASNTLTGMPIGSGTGAGYGTYIPITTYPAYFIFIRGDRSAILSQGVYTVPTNTVMRISGSINTNNQTLPVSASNFTLISNPYPAAINFGSITKNNVKDNLYVWNPLLSSIGGYVSVAPDGNGGYTTAPGSTNSSQYIASGDAFFVQSADGNNAGSIVIKETDKNNSGSDNVFRPMVTATSMRVNLSGINADSSLTLVDGIFTSYADNNSYAVNNNNVSKMYNINENLCLGREKQLFAIERRPTINNTDTSFLKIYLLKNQSYQFAISAGNMDNSISAVLKDNYDIKINNSIINLDGSVNNINFSVTADSGSFAANRFSIVYLKNLVVLPITFESIEVNHQQKNAQLIWKMADETNIKEYIIETAVTISSFKPTATVLPALNNAGHPMYTWLDVDVAEGMHYYRVKSVTISGKESYSSIVKIIIENKHGASMLVAAPNLITGNKITFRLNNVVAGTYGVQLLDMEGQIIKTAAVYHDGINNTMHTINTSTNLATGKYLLQLSGNATKFSTSIIKE